MEHNKKERSSFSGGIGFVLAAAGSAVGLGNLWRFPYLAAQYGGGIFILVYIILALTFGFTLMTTEIAIGRKTKQSPGTAYKAINKKFGFLGVLAPIVPVIILPYYCVIGGWVVKYMVTFVSGHGLDAAADNFFGNFVGNSISPMIYFAVYLGLTAAVILLGVNKGIEKISKFLMPLLLIISVIISIYIFTLPGASDGYKYIFTINPKGLLNVRLWIFAFGQAFFSLSIAGNGTVIYGSYLSKSENVVTSAGNVAIFDTLAALLAAFVIIPGMAVGGAELSSGGPGLMFVYLVNVFNGMPGGKIVGIVFYICVLFAGMSSLVNLYEAPVATMQEKFGLKRPAAVGVIAAIGCIVGLAIQGIVSGWMDAVSIYICPLGAMLAGIMFFWVAGKDFALEAVNQGKDKPIGKWFMPLGKYVLVPLAFVALVAGAILGGIG